MRFKAISGFVAVMVFAFVLLAVFGCGDSGPKAAVDGFMKAANDKDCEKMIDYIDLSQMQAQHAPFSKDDLVQSCKDEGGLGEIGSYNITEEKIDGDKATVKVEMTVNENGTDSTKTDTINLVQIDGQWKVSLF